MEANAFSCPLPPDASSDEKAVARLASAANAPVIGVRNPIRVAAPNPISNKPMAQPGTGACGAPIAPLPWLIALKATASRIRTRPALGHPAGKMENSLCTPRLLGRLEARHQPDYFLPR